MSERVLVTGAAGFIGSHLSRRLLERGDRVIGVDAFIDYYPRAMKEANLEPLLREPAFEFIEEDLATADASRLLEGVTSICHLAAQAGVRASWGEGFSTYVRCNVSATQRLLEAAKRMELNRFVYASSSSVYGDTSDLPMREDGLTRPVSPYGVTKLAGEHLAVLYYRNYGVPTVSLRYFTVYGPGQRPDMAFHRFIRAGLTGAPVHIYGSGEQTRDFTFIDDIVEGTERALRRGRPGEVLNLGGGSRVTVNDALGVIESLLGADIERLYERPARGDVADTLASNDRARAELGFDPTTELSEGLKRQCDWMRTVVSHGG